MTGGWLSLVAGTAVVFTVLLFARALVHKLADFTAFTGFVADYGVVPERMVRPAALAVVAAEAAVVALLLIPATAAAGGVLAAAVLAAYGLAMAAVIRSGRRFVECGCGGAVQPVGRPLLVRNAILAAVALSAAIGGADGFGLGETLAVIVSGFTAFVGYLLAEQLLGNAAHAAARP